MSAAASGSPRRRSQSREHDPHLARFASLFVHLREGSLHLFGLAQADEHPKLERLRARREHVRHDKQRLHPLGVPIGCRRLRVLATRER